MTLRHRPRRHLPPLLPLLLLLPVFAGCGGSSGGSRTGSAAPGARTRTESAVTAVYRPVGRLPAAVQDPAAAPAGTGIVLLGGLSAQQRSTDAITQLAAAGAASAHGRLPAVQHDAQAAALAGHVYVFGGGDQTSYDHILAYDPGSGSVSSAGRLPAASSDDGVATIGSTAYVVGGYTGSRPLDTIVAWTPSGGAHVVARLPYPVRYAAVAAAGGRLVIAGGSSGAGAVRTILSFDPATRAVRPLGHLPSELTHAAAAETGGKVLVIGGRGAAANTPRASILAIDPATGAVTRAGRLPRALSDLAAVSTPAGIVVAGGRTATATVDTVGLVTLRTATHTVTVAPPARAAAPGAALPGPVAPRGVSASYLPAAGRAGQPPGYILIADRGNNRILVVSPDKRVVWRFPTATDLAKGGRLVFNDDTFVAPDGLSLMANEEDNHAIVSVGIYTRRLTVLFGHPGHKGSDSTHLNTPDDAYPLADGTAVVADAYNCRVLYIKDHRITRRIGDGTCAHDPPRSFGAINGDTPMPDGGILVSEINGGWVDHIGPDGRLVKAYRTPLTYPSDPQPLAGGQILVADYADPGRLFILDRRGRVIWRYAHTAGVNRLNHPSLAMMLPNGDIAVNDDYRARVVVISRRAKKVVWQYGHTDHPGRRNGYLNIPDGMDYIPIAANGGIDWGGAVHP